MIGEHLNSDLFNFQIWCHAYDRAVKGRSLDYIIATLNQMGVKPVLHDLTKVEETSKEIAKSLDLGLTGQISSKMLLSSEPVAQISVDFWLEKSDSKAQRLIEENAAENGPHAKLTENLRVISFIATVANREMEAAGLLGHDLKFANETEQQFRERKEKLVVDINARLKEFQKKGEDFLEDLVA
jgi:hypothetical protein